MGEQFDAATRSSLADAEEIDLKPAGTSRAVTIWIVRAGEDIYVRSFRGADGRWFQSFRANPRASVMYGGGDLEVRGEPVSDEDINRAIDAAYLEKYRTSQYAGSMVTPEVAATTMRLLPA